MSRKELCELVCGCLKTLGAFPKGCGCETSIPDLTDGRGRQLVACIVARGQERGCRIILGPGNVTPGMTVDDLCRTIERRMSCD